jgi:4-hydroxybenzoate polyprenyltransferase
MGTASPGAGRRLWRTVVLLADLVRVEEVLFSLPMAFAGAVLAARGRPPLGALPWIVLAVAGGKIGGMAFNRFIDRDLDARHPETAGRALPAGLLPPGAALATGAGGLALLAVAAFELNPLCAMLLPVLIGLVVVYSYTKRWGWGCHFALASIGFCLPFAGWIAVTGRADAGAFVFGAASACWYVGFDSLYALRDVVWDRRLGVHSLPADLGVPATLAIARAAHVLFLGGLVLLGFLQRLPWPYAAAVAGVAAALAWQHLLTTRALRPVAFSRFNTAVSLALLVGIALAAHGGVGG